MHFYRYIEKSSDLQFHYVITIINLSWNVTKCVNIPHTRADFYCSWVYSNNNQTIKDSLTWKEIIISLLHYYNETKNYIYLRRKNITHLISLVVLVSLDFFADLKDINRQSHTYTHSNNDNDVKTTQENLACQY